MSEGIEKRKGNLISFVEMPPERQREIARMGAEASNRKQKQKKLLKEYLQAALELEDDEGVDRYTKITRALINKAEDGDTKAYEVVRDTLGQKPKEEVEQKQEIKVVMDDNTKEWGK